MAAKTYVRTGRVFDPGAAHAEWYGQVSDIALGEQFTATLSTDAEAWLLQEGVITAAPRGSSSGGSGSPAWNVVQPTADYTAAANDFVLINPGILVQPCTVTADSPTLTGPSGSFTDALVGRVVGDNIDGDGHIPVGTTVVSVESATSLTMSANATGSGSADWVQFTTYITLPSPTAGHRVAVENVVNQGSGAQVVLGDGNMVQVGDMASNGFGVAVFVGDGVNWQTESFYTDPRPTTPPLFSRGARPLPQSPGPASGSPVWSSAANGGSGGWVQDAVMRVVIDYHSSTWGGAVSSEIPQQRLQVGWSHTANLGTTPQPDVFSFMDFLPAGGHTGPSARNSGPDSGEAFNVKLMRFTGVMIGVYGVVRLDGTASCVVPAVPNANITSAYDGTAYNMDSALLGWGSAVVQGTDLTADATNHWIHSTAGGAVSIFSTFALLPSQDDSPAFAAFS